MTSIYIDFNKERKNGDGTKDNPYSSDYKCTETNEASRFFIRGTVEADQLEPILESYGSESAKPLILQGYALE